jgi:cytochrome c oxidase subunit 3
MLSLSKTNANINSIKTIIVNKQKYAYTNKWVNKNAEIALPTHPYHIVDQSPWPIAISAVLLSLTTSAVLSFHGYPMGEFLLLCSFILLNWGMTLWFKDIITEASYLGAHTDKVQKGISLGVALFIISEIFFFLSIFWAYFHSSLAPAIEIGSEWPPKGIEPVNASEVPTANTTLLLSSGSAVTVTHHSLVDRLIDWANNGSVATIYMAVLFTALQGMEYIGVSYTITDSVFGSTFFMGTGFHGCLSMSLFLFLILLLFKNYLLKIKDKFYNLLININYNSRKLYFFAGSPVVTWENGKILVGSDKSVHTKGFDTNVEIIRNLKEGYVSVVKLDTQEEIGRVPFTDGLRSFDSKFYADWKATDRTMSYWEKDIAWYQNRLRLDQAAAEAKRLLNNEKFQSDIARKLIESENAKKLIESANAKKLIESDIQNGNKSLQSVMDEFDGGFNIPLINRLFEIFDSSYFFAFMNFFLFSLILFCLVAFVKYFLYIIKKYIPRLSYTFIKD